jgi:hypothetical protein
MNCTLIVAPGKECPRRRPGRGRGPAAIPRQRFRSSPLIAATLAGHPWRPCADTGWQIAVPGTPNPTRRGMQRSTDIQFGYELALKNENHRACLPSPPNGRPRSSKSADYVAATEANMKYCGIDLRSDNSVMSVIDDLITTSARCPAVKAIPNVFGRVFATEDRPDLAKGDARQQCLPRAPHLPSLT